MFVLFFYSLKKQLEDVDMHDLVLHTAVSL